MTKYGRWVTTVALCMSARVHDRGIFSPMEDWNLDIRKYVSDHIGDYVIEK